MPAAPVSVCLIVRNESNQLDSCLKSLRPHVSEIVVVDTGSTDTSSSIAKNYADKFEVFTDCNNPETGLIENFALARQKSFSLATQPWTMWVDGDDEVQGAENLSRIIEEKDSWRKGHPMLVTFPYEYSHDYAGRPTCVHYRERLVSPKSAFRWIGPVHEVLNPEVPGTYHNQSDLVKVVHRRFGSGKVVDPGRNLRILKKHYEENGESDVRQLYYLGLEYGNNGFIEESIKFHKRYVELSGWDDEKFMSCMNIASHYQDLGTKSFDKKESSDFHRQSIEWACRATTVREGWGEAYFSVGRNFYYLAQKGGPEERRNWEKSVYFFRAGLNCPPTKTSLFINPLEREFDVQVYMNLALHQIGETVEALESTERGLKIWPEDKGLLQNQKFYKSILIKSSIESNLKNLVESGILTEESSNKITDTLHGRDSSLVKSLPPKKKLPVLDIIFYVGNGWESWNPRTVAVTGIGGSEIAVIEMSKRLASLGHQVRVYGDCQDMLSGIYDGVRYIHYTEFKNTSCDVLITSRRPDATDESRNVSYKRCFCWVHDVHCGDYLTFERSQKIDKFLVLSKWHKDFFLDRYGFSPSEKVIQTRNGIDTERFSKKIIRNPHKAVYSSSPDRGLEVALKVWPRIREKIPDAELHIFYGFKSLEKMGKSKFVNELKASISGQSENGIHFRGRLSQEKLAMEFLSAGVWAYPTAFTETSCITAMEAQAAGLYTVTSPIAALNETVGSFSSFIPGDNESESYQEAFTNSVIRVMLTTRDSDRQSVMEQSIGRFGWDSLAQEWDLMIRSSVQEIYVEGAA